MDCRLNPAGAALGTKRCETREILTHKHTQLKKIRDKGGSIAPFTHDAKTSMFGTTASMKLDVDVTKCVGMTGRFHRKRGTKSSKNKDDNPFRYVSFKVCVFAPFLKMHLCIHCDGWHHLGCHMPAIKAPIYIGAIQLGHPIHGFSCHWLSLVVCA